MTTPERASGRLAPSRALHDVALRLAAGGRADADMQQQVLRTLLEAGSSCAPRDVIAALDRRVARCDEQTVRTARARMRALDAQLVVIGDDPYPPALRDAWPELGAPVWLFWSGGCPPIATVPAVAVVGTRRPTLDGLRTAAALGSALAVAGVTVVSGMARGIDQAAHRGALDGGGTTVAVLGTGLGVDYPARSAGLRAAIRASGALLCELPPGVGPRPWQFLARNRIISGLASATVVVEGRARSGALQTARLAGAQGRDVWAVPGSINTPTSAAPLALLRDGAIPLTDIDDFVAAVGAATVSGVARPPPDRTAGLSPHAAALLELLGAVPASADALSAASTLPAHAVLAAVSELVERGLGAMTPHGIVRA